MRRPVLPCCPSLPCVFIMTSSPLSPSSIPLGLPVVEPSEAVSPAARVLSEVDNYVTSQCEEPKAKIIPEKVCA